MEPFTEATYDELNRILKIMDHPKAKMGLDLGWMTDWTDGKPSFHERNKGPTISMIEYWERVIGG